MTRREAHPVREALDAFVSHTIKTYPDLEAPFDPDWRSPAEIGLPYKVEDGERIAWQPTPRDPHESADDFAPLERALESAGQPDSKADYGADWSGGLEAGVQDGTFRGSVDGVAGVDESFGYGEDAGG